MRNNRTTEQNRALFDALNRTVNRYVREKLLFNGGCCYAAFALARCLDHAGISYRVAVYQDGAFRCRSLKSVCKREACAHVAIVVNDNGRDMILGDTSCIVATLDMYNYFYGTQWKVKEYKAGWRELEDAYYNNDWNPDYDTRNNAYFYQEIQKIFKEL